MVKTWKGFRAILSAVDSLKKDRVQEASLLRLLRVSRQELNLEEKVLE